MRVRLLLFQLLALVAMLLASASASARVPAQTRVGAIDVVLATCTELETSRTLEHRPANRIAERPNAADSCVAAEGVEAATTAGRLPWGFFRDYPKVIEAGTEYARIGERLYTEHAVVRMLPTGMGGRGIAPAFVEDAIATGTQSTQLVNGVTRTVFSSGNVQVVTEQGGRLVVTVMRVGGP